MLNIFDDMPPAVLTTIAIVAVILNILKARGYWQKVAEAKREGRPAPTLAEAADNPIDRATGKIFEVVIVPIFIVAVWAAFWATVLFGAAAIVGAGWRFLR